MWEAIAVSAGLVFLAELGDKSQLLAMTLTTRYRARTVLLGSALAMMVLNLVSSLAGNFIGEFLPETWVRAAAGVLFLLFAVFSLRSAWKERSKTEPETPKIQGKIAIAAVFLAFCLAELGDKTMLTTAALSTQYAWYWVWIGSTIGMLINIALAVWLGRALLKIVPIRFVHVFAAVAFAVLGILILVQ